MSSSVIKAMSYAGVYVGAVIGAGYASGQEVMQFFSGYGLVGIVGAIITTVMFVWYGSVFMELGNRLQTCSHRDVLRYLCGDKLAFIGDYVLLFFMFGCVSIMFSGGGAAINEYWGLSVMTGKLIIAGMTLATVIFGFSSSVRALGIVSPIIIFSVIAISLITLGSHFDQLSTVDQSLEGLTPTLATPFWWTSAVVYVSYNVSLATSTLTAIGGKEPSLPTLRKAGIIGGISLGLCLLFITLALLSDLSNVIEYQIPFLQIAQNISPLVGILFSVVLVIAVFTTAVTNLYGCVIRFFDSKKQPAKFRTLTISLVALSLLASLFPFSTLINVLYPALGLLGMVIMVCALYKTVTGQIFLKTGAKLTNNR
ncbi:beta-carotene 15,15'-monooxygenase [Psychrobacter sp. FDAARGOS_221]|uniref:YkvI family membrane protein n=1 Tax=Psychrobacter sp. FDAARGOS_221 TaxID=1975705 RepID=UPI000BB55877|nr:beta-carotene 15,15'-monooxygenase [Psychrobacter sp. FDAARGOS_221]PNK59831.1 beta-carotene 15,15'-monooxygenase [Psychrobacter sp. FDAARGOS_221]